MRIAICSSMYFWDQILAVQKELELLGHTVFTPSKEGVDVDYAQLSHAEQVALKKSFIDRHIERIAQSDAILILNYTKFDKKYYIGANTFMEMAFGYQSGKKIFVLNELPAQPNTLEIEALSPVVLNNNLALIP